LDTALQPDLLFISNARAVVILDNYVAGAPDLVVEILSPSTAAHDRATKLALYAEARAPWVWFLDPQAKTEEVLRLEGRRYFVDSILAGDQILTSSLFRGWQLPLHELFDFRTSF
jgi:Uma2 family endonuclease